MLKFFCSICIEDVDAHPETLDMDNGYATCPVCGTGMETSYARPMQPTEEMLTLEHYNFINGIETNTGEQTP